MTRVALESLTLRYPGTDRAAVSDVSLTVEPGELLCLVGPSGCGKTTLLKAVSGLLPSSDGAVRFDDTDVTSVPPEKRRAVMVFQSHLLFPFLTVLDNVGFAGRMQGVPRSEWEAQARAMLARVHLAGFERRRPASLSSGQRQRVALARALAARPRVLLLDEPLSNLDRHLRDEMRQVILELQRSTRITTICVTHDQEEAVLLGDRIAMLSDGRLVQVGTAESFYERPVSVEVARFFGNHNQLEGEWQPVPPGAAFSCGAGDFALGEPSPEWPSPGRACLHIRPEFIELVEPGSLLPNVLAGSVLHRVYVGTHVRYVVDVAGMPWQVVAGPLAKRFDEGKEVGLRLPAERIWLTRE